MGLDMYLNKKIYVGAEYKHRKVTGKCEIKIGDKPLSINLNRISYIEERVGYWRKANHIHLWFVKNVQDGKDDCGDYSVSEKQLEQLLSICKQIKKECPLVPGAIVNGQTMTNGAWENNYEPGKLMQNSNFAAQLLPTKSGFFFGSTDYDEHYMADINDTIEIIETLLKEKEGEYLNGDIIYSSSW